MSISKLLSAVGAVFFYEGRYLKFRPRLMMWVFTSLVIFWSDREPVRNRSITPYYMRFWSITVEKYISQAIRGRSRITSLDCIWCGTVIQFIMIEHACRHTLPTILASQDNSLKRDQSIRSQSRSSKWCRKPKRNLVLYAAQIVHPWDPVRGKWDCKSGFYLAVLDDWP